MRLFASALTAALVACAQPADTAPDASAVIAAERAFATEAGQIGWVEAFEAHSAPEAILLAGAPTNAHQSLAGIDPANRGDTSLSWAPEYAGISRGGDIGFTTGPYNGGGTAFGQYFTVWRRQGDGSWKWIYDGGTNQLTPTAVNMEADVVVVPVAMRGSGSAEAAIEAVRGAETALAAAAANGAGAALGAVFAEAGRLNRDNQPTAVGVEAVTQAAGAGALHYEAPDMIEAGARGDLVFALGRVTWEGGAGYYCRIWVLQSDGWRIAYDQTVERAPQPPAPVEFEPPAFEPPIVP
jgi:hypothetical protein